MPPRHLRHKPSGRYARGAEGTTGMDWYTAAGVHSRDGLAGVGQFEEFSPAIAPEVDPGLLPTGLELEMPLPPLDMTALPPVPEPVAVDVPPSGVGVPSAAQVQQAILSAVRGG